MMTSAALERRAIILRIRAYVFVILVLLGILWTALLCVDSFSKGGFRSRVEAVSIIFFLTSQAFTPLCIPVLIILDHSDTAEKSRWHGHAWFEIVWLTGLFVCQFTAALLFTLMSPSFDCNNANADIQGECQLVNVYVSIAAWLTPAMLASFLGYLIAVCYRVSRRCPNVWRTPIRLVPWDHDASAEIIPKSDYYRPTTLNKPRSLEASSNESLSRFDSLESSSRGNTRSFEHRVYDNAATSYPPNISAPQPLSRNVVTRAPYLFPPLRIVSQPSPFKTFGQPIMSHSRAISQLPPHRIISDDFSRIDSSPHHFSWSSSTSSRDSRRSVHPV